MPKWRGVADAVVVAGLEHLDDAAMQEIDVGHVGVGAPRRAWLFHGQNTCWSR